MKSERMSVSVTARAARDLTAAAERSGLSKAEVINRAISLYRFVDDRLAVGCTLLMRSPDGGLETVSLL